MKGHFLLAVVVLTVLVIGFVTGKRSGGGSSFRSSYSSYRSYRSYSSYSSSSYRSYRASRVRSWTTSQKSAAATIGAIYISRRLRTRYGSGSDWDDDLQVCRNSQKYPAFNGTSTEYGWFLCPVDDAHQDYTHCCGSDGAEYCCKFWSSGAGIGAIVGIVIFCLVFIAVVVVALWCVLKKSKKTRTSPTEFSGGAVMYSNDTATVTEKNDGLPPSYSSTIGQSAPYPQQSPPYPPTGAAYPPPMPNSPPPAYPGAGAAAVPDSKEPPAAFSATS